jgi:hypothetical protein
MEQGDDFAIVLRLSDSAGPMNIEDYEFFGEMKSTTGEAMPVAEFTFAILDQVALKGQVKMSLASGDTEALIASIANAETKSRLTTPYLFDVKMKDTHDVITRILEGVVYLSPQVTQEP